MLLLFSAPALGGEFDFGPDGRDRQETFSVAQLFHVFLHFDFWTLVIPPLAKANFECQLSDGKRWDLIEIIWEDDFISQSCTTHLHAARFARLKTQLQMGSTLQLSLTLVSLCIDIIAKGLFRRGACIVSALCRLRISVC